MSRLTDKLRNRVIVAARKAAHNMRVTGLADMLTLSPAATGKFLGVVQADSGATHAQILHVLANPLPPDDLGGVWYVAPDYDADLLRAAIELSWLDWRVEGSVDLLLVRPHRAQAFAAEVRRLAAMPVSDELILSTLMALRKRGDLPKGGDQ